MSIQTELTRITNAKAAIKAAIEGKGVTVPDATLLDGMAVLIESIQTGGGSGGGIFAGGTFTVATSGYQTVTITHNLGLIPDVFIAFRQEVTGKDNWEFDVLIALSSEFSNRAGSGTILRRYVRYGQSLAKPSESGWVDVFDNLVQFYPSQCKFIAGTTYSWVAIGGLT